MTDRLVADLRELAFSCGAHERSAEYWHAIMRVDPFDDSCNTSTLPGRRARREESE